MPNDSINITACNSECVKLDFLGSCGSHVCVFGMTQIISMTSKFLSFLWPPYFVFFGTTQVSSMTDRSIQKFLVVTVFVFFSTIQIISITYTFTMC